MNNATARSSLLLLLLSVLGAVLSRAAYPMQPMTEWKGSAKTGHARCFPSTQTYGAICPGPAECSRINGPIFCSEDRLYHADFDSSSVVQLGQITPRVQHCSGTASHPDGTLWAFGYERIGFTANIWKLDAETARVTQSYSLQIMDQKVHDIAFDSFVSNGTMYAVVDSIAQGANPPRREWHIARVIVPVHLAEMELEMIGSLGLPTTSAKGTVTTVSLVITRTGHALAIWVDPSVHWRDASVKLKRVGPTTSDQNREWDITDQILKICGLSDGDSIGTVVRVDMHYDHNADRIFLWVQCRGRHQNQAILAHLALPKDVDGVNQPASLQAQPIIRAETVGFSSKSASRGISALYERHYCIDTSA